MALNKTKNIYLDILQEEFELPKDNQRIVRVLTKNPNHIFDVMGEDGNVYKAILHSRFQKAVWVKVNKLVLVEDVGGDYPEIVKVPTEDYVKFLRKNKVIPNIFDKADTIDRTDDSGLFVNTNQRRIEYSSSSESSSEDDTI